VVGDFVDVLGRWRVWGGLLNALAVALFLVNTLSSIEVAQPRSTRHEPI
jgi:hypothetical protein